MAWRKVHIMFTAIAAIPKCATDAFSNRCEKLLEGFEPDCEFTPVNPLPEAQFAESARQIRREAAVGYDALVLHTDIIGWYLHTSS